MDATLTYRKATRADLRAIIFLLLQDELGKTRENLAAEIDQRYIDAFEKINTDPNQYLMVAELDRSVVGSCHLTIMPSLTFTGSTRMQIEAVRIHESYRRQKLGEQMLHEVIRYGKSQGASIIQLTTNKKRVEALKFYQRVGFESTHEGMKLYLD